jgi:hypothetical protein
LQVNSGMLSGSRLSSILWRRFGYQWRLIWWTFWFHKSRIFYWSCGRVSDCRWLLDGIGWLGSITTRVAVYFMRGGKAGRYNYVHCSKWAGICRCTIPELIFVPEFHTGTYQYILYAFIFSVFLTAYPCFDFEKFTVAKVSFRALLKHHITGRRCRVVLRILEVPPNLVSKTGYHDRVVVFIGPYI